MLYIELKRGADHDAAMSLLPVPFKASRRLGAYQARQFPLRKFRRFIPQGIDVHARKETAKNVLFCNVIADHPETITSKRWGKRECMEGETAGAGGIQQERRQRIAIRQGSVEIECRDDLLVRLHPVHNFIRLNIFSGINLMISMM